MKKEENKTYLYASLVSLILSVIAFLGSTGYSAPSRDQKGLTLKQMLGQMFILGFASDSTESLKQEGMQDLLEANNIGGIILFDQSSIDKTPRNIRNFQQIQNFVSKLKSLRTSHPPLITIDQEGGAVERLKIKYGFVEVKGAQELALKGDRPVACGARIIGSQLATLGFDINFAPVVDITTPTSLGSRRTYSEKPETTEAFGALTISQLHAANVATSLKHFPGMSLADQFGDTHKQIVSLRSDWLTEGPKSAFKPFSKLKELADLVMVSHLKNPYDNLPSSLSPQVISVLRKQVGFNGLVITDDLDMSGIPDDWPLTEVVKKAILAGNDFILIGNNIKYRPEVIKTMLEDIGDSVAKGDIPAERIRESYRKIVSFKRKLASNNLTHLKALQCTDAEMTKYWSEIIRQPDEEDRGLLKEKNLNPDDWGSANLILSPE